MKALKQSAKEIRKISDQQQEELEELLAIQNRNFKKAEELEELLAIQNRNFKIRAILSIISIILFSIIVVDIIIKGVA
jgi:hypothetical protein